MNILLGYDGSNASKAALDLARMHAKTFGAQLHIVASLTKGTENEQETIRRLEAELDQMQADCEASGIACKTHLLIRGLSPGEDLVQFSRESGVDEIVIGVRRRSKVGKLVFGSTAQYVILHAPCPVVSVK